jgi:hypothetical protein
MLFSNFPLLPRARNGFKFAMVQRTIV